MNDTINSVLPKLWYFLSRLVDDPADHPLKSDVPLLASADTIALACLILWPILQIAWLLLVFICRLLFQVGRLVILVANDVIYDEQTVREE
jgi:hypothetical protein